VSALWTFSWWLMFGLIGFGLYVVIDELTNRRND
jgi:hypothetical protein